MKNLIPENKLVAGLVHLKAKCKHVPNALGYSGTSVFENSFAIIRCRPKFALISIAHPTQHRQHMGQAWAASNGK